MATMTLSAICNENVTACTPVGSDLNNVCITWDATLKLPPLPGDSINIGVAGGYAGIIGGKLILAGGANFPDGFPWTGAKKIWHRNLYVFNPVKNTWEIFENFLPLPIAYGVSITIPSGVLMIGGNNDNGRLDTVWLLTIENGKPRINKDRYPSLPFPLSNAAGALIDNFVYLAGGTAGVGKEEEASHTFLRLDLDHPEDGWEELLPWSGPTLGYSVAAGANHKFYLFGGRDFGKDKVTAICTDGYEYDPKKNLWEKLDIEFPVMAGTAVTLNNKIYFFGGVDKILPTDPFHPGFPRVLREYDPISGRIQEISESPAPVAVTTTAVLASDKTIYIVSGEIRPGIRTPVVLRCRVKQ